MRQRASIVVTVAVVAGVATVLFGPRLTPVHGQAKQEARFAAVPTEKGGQDIFDPRLQACFRFLLAESRVLRFVLAASGVSAGDAGRRSVELAPVLPKLL